MCGRRRPGDTKKHVNHEIFDNTVEMKAIIETRIDQFKEITCSFGALVCVKLYLYITKCC